MFNLPQRDKIDSAEVLAGSEFEKVEAPTMI